MENTVKIGAPCNPATRISYETKAALKLTIAYGNQTEVTYGVIARGVPLFDAFHCFREAVTGDTIDINISFVVKIEYGLVVKTEWDATDWGNYGKTKPRYRKCTITTYHWIPQYMKHEVCEEYLGGGFEHQISEFKNFEKI